MGVLVGGVGVRMVVVVGGGVDGGDGGDDEPESSTSMSMSISISLGSEGALRNHSCRQATQRTWPHGESLTMKKY